MNVFLLGLRVTDTAATEDGVTNVITVSLPPSDKKIPTKVVLSMKADHYVGKLLNGLKENETILAIGPTKANPDGVLQMQPILVVTQGNWDDLLAINLFIATGGLGPIATEKELGDNTVTNRSLAWQDEKKETQWFALSGWNKLSKEMAELPPGTPTIAVGSFTSSEREDKKFINYGVSKVLYLPRGSKPAPKKAADPEKGVVSKAALGSLDFSL